MQSATSMHSQSHLSGTNYSWRLRPSSNMKPADSTLIGNAAATCVTLISVFCTAGFGRLVDRSSQIVGVRAWEVSQSSQVKDLPRISKISALLLGTVLSA